MIEYNQILDNLMYISYKENRKRNSFELMQKFFDDAVLFEAKLKKEIERRKNEARNGARIDEQTIEN